MSTDKILTYYDDETFVMIRLDQVKYMRMNINKLFIIWLDVEEPTIVQITENLREELIKQLLSFPIDDREKKN